MTDRRNFIKRTLLAGVSMTVAPNLLKAAEVVAPSAMSDNAVWGMKRHKPVHWLWISPKATDEVEALNERYKKYYKAGIRGILFAQDSEKHFRAAKAQGIEAHRWIWTMNRGDKTLMESIPIGMRKAEKAIRVLTNHLM